MKKKLSLILYLVIPSIASCSSLFYLGSHLNYLSFKFNNPGKLKGPLAGVKGGLSFTRDYLFGDINMEASWNIGRITGSPCQRSSIQEYFAQSKLGFIIPACCDAVTLTPYTGFGYNHFHNKQDPTTAGLSYKYTKLFMPLGILLDGTINQNMAFGLQLEARFDVYALLKVICEKLEIQKKYAFRVQTPFTIYTGCNCQHAVSIVPFFDWNRFGRAVDTTCLGVALPIPQLTRWEIGARLLFSFVF
jgi:hypothetical protein